MPVVSVLMPVYNALPYLDEAVASILNQSWSDLELVALDDGSSDGSWERLGQLAETDPRLRIHRHAVNRGVPATRNHLFELADPAAEFLAIMDSDDIADRLRLERQVALLRQHPELAGTGSCIRIIDTASQVMAERRYPLEPAAIRRLAIRANPFAHPTLCFRRAVLTRLGAYDPQLASCEDYDFILRALQHFDFANLPDFLLHYRMSPRQWKQAHLRDSLRATLAIQRRYLGRPPFRSLAGCLSHLAKYPLLLLPERLVLRLFTAITYRSVRNP